MGKLSSIRGMEIIHQGAQQFMAMWEDFNCPFNERKQPVERKLWLKGWHEAKIKWFKTFERARKPFRRPNEQQANNRRMPKKAKA